MSAHRAGQLDAARQGYTAVLEHEPENFDALNLLGVVATQLGQPDVGETLLELALRVKPQSHEAMGNLAVALREQGREHDAEAALRRALAIAPAYVDGLRNLANLCRAQGRLAEAIDLLRRASAAAPQNAVVRGNLGAFLLDSGMAEEAWSHLERASRALGNDPAVLANLGRAGLEVDRTQPAVEACERALRLAPAHLPALVTLSALERVHGRFDAAERYARRALDAAPADRGAALNLATALVEMARYDECTQIFDRMIQTDPRDVEAHTGRAVVALARGRPELAWLDHAWRWRLPMARIPHPPALPEWRGEPLGGGTLYVWPEQGIGDEVIYASLIPDLADRVSDAVLAADPRLVDVFQRSFPSVRVVAAEALNRAAGQVGSEDRQCSIVDLGPILRPTLDAFPKRAGYLVAEASRMTQWQHWLASLGPLPKVGISWRSQDRSGERRLACTELAQWAPVLAVSGVQFVCVQYDECSEELRAAEAAFGVSLHVPPGLDQRNDLDGVIALMHSLDLVVTVATAVSALAGSTGTPTWELARGVDWHSMGRERSPWQPSVQPFYRRWEASWEAVLGEVAGKLEEFAALGHRTRAA